MKLTVNGKLREFQESLTGGELLAELKIALSTAVAEVNGHIVPRTKLAELVLHEGDTIELVTIVGGG